jgi:primosomal protein N' (replication factor Y)
MRLVFVAVPVPALDALTYSVPDEFPDPVVGARVLVPLGKRVMTGVVVRADLGFASPVSRTPSPDSPSTSSPEPRAPSPDSPSGIRSILDLLDREPFVSPDVVALTTWVAEYYACGVGEAVATAMPPRAWIESERYAQITDAGHARLLQERGLRRTILETLAHDKPVRVDAFAGEGSGAYGALAALERDGLVQRTQPLKGTASAFRTVRVAALAAQGHEDGLDLGARQQQAIDLLKAAPAGLDTADLQARGIGAQTLKRLGALGLVTFSRRRVERDPFDCGAAMESGAPTAHVLTGEQSAALATLRQLAGQHAFHAVLLHGVTGSGKTELYVRLAQQVREGGRGVLLLVPEIALTPAVAATFRTSFGERVAIQHSALSDGERHDQWQRIRRGEVDVVVGTRSAVFAPLQRVGLIIVDEEHDGSYKQEESPRYHGRDVAIVRARQARALVVLGSATPSMESHHNALNGRYSLITLERRVLDRPMAAVRIVNMREEYATAGPDTILSAALTAALADRLERQEQGIVLLNRRGFATVVFCRQCGHSLECPNCSVSLTVHRAARRARCHYCNFAMPLPKTCVKCAGPYLEQTGFGTERVEADIAALFPSARVARVDRDTVRKRGAIAALLTRFAARQIDVLVGTQMIAKGHDFPHVTLVGVISADVGLGLADFRAAERTFQLLTQVAGRAGRGEIRGEAVVQTLYPDHYSIRHACRQDYTAFYNDEINYRRSMRYPPAVALINAVVKGRTQDGAMQDAGEVVRALRWGGEPYRVLGPAPAPLSRLRGEHRAQFFMKGTHRRQMREALLAVLADRPEIRRRTIVDVDPMSVL